MSEIIEILSEEEQIHKKIDNTIPKPLTNILFGISVIYGIYSFILAIKFILFFFSSISVGAAIFVTVVVGVPLLFVAFFISAIPYFTLNWGIEWAKQNLSNLKKYLILFFTFILGFILSNIASLIFGFLLGLFI